jgi:NAD kinase
MEFKVVGRNIHGNAMLKKVLLRLGLMVGKEPDIIICLGGDGTFLFNERKYPGIPKLLIRDSDICMKCENKQLDGILMGIANGKYQIEEYSKLEVRYKNQVLTATNDFIIRNKVPTQAIRFRVKTAGRDLGLMIGDGVVVSSAFGSTGYHYSITKKSFMKGIGVAFNNTTGQESSLLLPEEAKVSVSLVRHDAHLGYDNSPKVLTIKEGESVSIRKSREVARIVRVI